MKTNKYFIYPDFLIKIGIVVILIFAMIAEMEYGFYVLVRCLVTASSIYFAMKTFEKKEKKLFVFFAITAILFNPIFEFSFTRDVWQVVDLFVAFITALSIDYDYLHLEIKEKFKEESVAEASLLIREEKEIINKNDISAMNSIRPNIFQKIAIINYISILIFICTYFVPHIYIRYSYRLRYESSDSYPVTKHFYGSIFNSSEIDIVKLFVFIFIPTIIFGFLYKYLETLNKLDFNIYRKKGKFELNILLAFLFIVIGTVLLSYSSSVVLDLNSFNDLNQPNEKELIEGNIVFVFLTSFFLLYIVRPLFLIFKGMFNEVN
jgi:hypothetical protein